MRADDPRRQNLRRGGQSDTTKARAAAAALEQREAAEEEAIGQAARSPAGPDDAIVELFEKTARATSRMLDKWLRQRGEPSRAMIEAEKETRQLGMVARDILIARGRTAEAETFFATVAARLDSANLVEGPRPVLHVQGPGG